MTVASETSKVIYSGNGSTTVFSTSFSFLNNSDVKVVLTSTLNIETTLSITTHYTLSGGGGAVGNVTMITAPASGEKLTIYREPPITQVTDYVNGDSFDAESHERALDKLTQIAQNLKENASRSLKLAVSSTASSTLPVPTANKILAWNDTETALVNLSVSNILDSFGGKTFADFGVIGNGTENDTVALNLAFASGNVIYCNDEVIKFSKVTASSPVRLIGKVTLQHDGSSITGTSALTFNNTLRADHLIIRGNSTDTVYDLLNTVGGSFIDILELQSDAQRANARGGHTNNGSHCHIGFLKTKNVARPHVTETTGDYLESLFIGGYEIDTYIRGIKTSRLEYANIGAGIAKNEWDGITAIPGYNGILIEETRFLILGDQIIEDSAEHGLRIGGGGDGMTGFRIGNITTVNTGGCAVKLNVDPSSLVRGGSIGDINGINCGRGSTAGNKEVCRITRARNISVGVISGSESVTNLVTLADFDNIYIQGLRGDDVQKSYIKIDKGQDTSDGDGKNLYIGGVSGKSINNRAVIEVDYADAGRSLENIVIDNVTVSDYTDYLVSFVGTPTINGIFKITANLPSSAVVPKTENPPNTSNYVVDITYGSRRYIGRGDTTEFTCGLTSGAGTVLDLSASPSSNGLGGIMSQSLKATAGNGAYGGSFIASRAGSSRRGAGIASKQIGVNSYKQGIAFLVQNAGTTATDVLSDVGGIMPNGVLSLPLLPTYATNALALAGGLVVGDFYKTATGELRIVV